MSAGERIFRWYKRVKDFLRHFACGLWRRLDEHHVLLAASGLSFSIIICIIPFLLVIFSVMGMLLAGPTITAEIDSLITRFIPYPEYAEQVRKFVAERVEEFWTYRKLAGWLGSLGLLFAASGLFSSMRTVLDTVFETPGKRSAILAKLHDIGLVLLVMVFFLLSTVILPILEGVIRTAWASPVLKALNLSFVEGMLFAVVSFLLIWLGFYLIYVLVPHRRPPHRVLFISSLTGAVLWQAAERVFGYYLGHVVTFKQIYGTYSFLLVAALWLYYTSVIFILGAEIGRLSDEWKNRAKPDIASGLH
ncbi:MAG: YihY/virulence factor BrkB family protein [candidate division Zixibacteria bacterium]|nr:YihY/virulence factor BrkB family protein [candidate division Zixibacteria bacterium]